MIDSLPILIIDDDLRMRELLVEIFSEQGYLVTAVADGEAAVLAIKDNSFALIITDLQMPKLDGIAILKQVKALDTEVPVIVITGHGSIDSAIAAMKQGAYDYLEKPFDPEQLLLVAGRALKYYRLSRENRKLDAALKELRGHDLIGNGKGMQKVKELVARIAYLDVTVLIQGETGTGKELVARLIHRHSRRADHRFLPINCGAVPENLLESELFGYEKGAFSGADLEKKGLVGLACGGTLFLDEINNMPTAFQVKLLRFLQDQSFMRIGGSRELHGDVRIVTATNVNLAEEVAAKRFRDDLYFRLKVMVVKLPPLRERLEDIPELAYYFLRKYSKLYDKDIDKIDRRTLDLFIDHPWSGNIRELENIVSSSVIMATGSTLATDCLPEEFRQDTLLAPAGESLNLGVMEQHLIGRALQKTNDNKARAARLLGIDTSTLWRKLKRHNLQ